MELRIKLYILLTAIKPFPTLFSLKIRKKEQRRSFQLAQFWIFPKVFCIVIPTNVYPLYVYEWIKISDQNNPSLSPLIIKLENIKRSWLWRSLHVRYYSSLIIWSHANIEISSCFKVLNKVWNSAIGFIVPPARIIQWVFSRICANFTPASRTISWNSHLGSFEWNFRRIEKLLSSSLISCERNLRKLFRTNSFGLI